MCLGCFHVARYSGGDGFEVADGIADGTRPSQSLVCCTTTMMLRNERSFSFCLLSGKSSAASGAEELGAPAAPAPLWAQKK